MEFGLKLPAADFDECFIKVCGRQLKAMKAADWQSVFIADSQAAEHRDVIEREAHSARLD